MQLVSIEGLELHDITKYSVKRQDLDGPDSTRSENGVLSRERIRAGVFTLEIGLTAYTDAELSTLVDRLAAEVINVYFYFGTIKTMQAYSSNQSIDLKSNPDGVPYWDISFNLIEY